MKHELIEKRIWVENKYACWFRYLDVSMKICCTVLGNQDCVGLDNKNCPLNKYGSITLYSRED